MIRQAHTYLAGAVSGTALIGAAVVAFVLLVSLQALRDWPLAGIGGGSEAAVSSGQPAGGEGTAAAAAGASAAPGAAAGAANRQAQSKAGGNPVERVGDGGTSTGAGAPPGTAPPAAELPAPTPGSAGSPSPAASAPASGSGNGSGNGGGGSGTSSSGDGGAGGGSTSGAVTGTVNDTVAGVDKVVGGALSETGVPQVTEEVVNGVAGPSSPVGKTVDKVVETVGGLLGGKR